MIAIDGTVCFPNRIDTPSIYAIATGLGRAPRFAGQTRILYPVLAHSFVVANLVYHATGDPTAALCGLIHDAPEAFLGDTPSTWKGAAEDRNERRIMSKILPTLNLDFELYDAAHWHVKAADLLALAAEAHVLGHAAADEYWPGAGLDAMHHEARAMTTFQLTQVDEYRHPESAAWRLSTAIAYYQAARVDARS